MNTTESDQVHIIFFPLMAQGHIIPCIDIAKLFAARNVKATIITTPLNAPLINTSIQKYPTINLKVIKFPTRESGLPDNIENLDAVTSQEQHGLFFKATSLLQAPVEDILGELKPHGFVSDHFFPWSVDSAAKFGIPRLVFHGTSFFAMCAFDVIARFEPHKKIESDSEQFLLPNFPDQIKLTRNQLPDHERLGFQNNFTRLMGRAREAHNRSYGTLVNSFYELEPSYADYFRNVIGKRAWHIGPVSLCNRNAEEKAQRGFGKENSINEHDCLKWLETKKPRSVVYVCFGTTSKFPDTQLREIATGLESSGQDFIWVVPKHNANNEEWLPEGFESKIEGKGLIIRGWAPQVLILDHESIGCFVTHCGWNSALEGISTGLPMVTWPIFADQFYNEKLITDVLKIGVGVGAQQWVRLVGDFVKKDAIENAIGEIMIGEQGAEMKRRAKEFGEMAKKAVAQGDSSYNDMSALIHELRTRQL